VHLAEHMDRYYSNVKLSQAYYGVFKEKKMSGSLSQESASSEKDIEECEQSLRKNLS
jgi:hypothetical protein